MRQNWPSMSGGHDSHGRSCSVMQITGPTKTLLLTPGKETEINSIVPAPLKERLLGGSTDISEMNVLLRLEIRPVA